MKFFYLYLAVFVCILTLCNFTIAENTNNDPKKPDIKNELKDEKKKDIKSEVIVEDKKLEGKKDGERDLNEIKQGDKPVKEDELHEEKNEEANKHIKDSFDPYDEEHLDDEEMPLDKFDFDPSEGLSFYVSSSLKECFYEDVKETKEHLKGAYLVTASNPEIDIEIKDPEGEFVFTRYDVPEGEFDVKPEDAGTFEICFHNRESEVKLVTFVTHTLSSQHPVEKEHVSMLAKYSSHLDVKLGELESEQRLMEIRTDRHIKS